MYANLMLGTAQNLVLAAESGFVPLEGTDYHLDRLDMWTTGFAEVHRRLYVTTSGGAAPDIDRLNREPLIALVDLQEGSYVDMDTWCAPG